MLTNWGKFLVVFVASVLLSASCANQDNASPLSEGSFTSSTTSTYDAREVVEDPIDEAAGLANEIQGFVGTAFEEEEYPDCVDGNGRPRALISGQCLQVEASDITSSYAVGTGSYVTIYISATASEYTWKLTNPGPFETGDRVLELTGNRDGTRAEVVVPVKPNGTLGWVDLDTVSVRTSNSKITVSLSEKTATLKVGGEVIHVAAVAVGKDETPTPLLESVIDVLLVNANSTGPYGTHIFGTNQHSEVLDTFGGGRPAIAIHGTNKPDLLGQAVSNGCVRMHNDDILIFSEHVELGTRFIVVE